MTANGKDKFGPFILDTHILPCDVCGTVAVRLGYNGAKYKLPDGIDAKATILPNPQRMWIGITCGCYAKLHRQVAHIEDAQKRAKK